MAKLNFQYHPEIDMLEIEGLHYSGDYFRDMSEFKDGEKFSVIKRDGTVLYLQRRPTWRAVDGYRRLLALALVIKNNLLAWLRGVTRRN